LRNKACRVGSFGEYENGYETEMSVLLVSFCNVSPSDFILGAYDFENGRFQWIDTASVAPESAGATGIAVENEHYWIVRQAVHSSIVKLDAQLKATAVYPLPVSRDAHSLMSFDGGLLVADTQRNCVNLARLSDDRSAVVETEFWRQCQSNDKDEMHVNSICVLNGEVYVSFFGKRPVAGWQSSLQGKIVNINTGEVICDDLQHPHTLLLWSGDIYWLESKVGRLYKYTPGGKYEVILQLEGYLRGLVFDGDYIYIGASAIRRKSRSTGTLNQIASENPDNFHSWIYRVSQRTGNVERRNMTGFGAEIYDLFPIPAMPFQIPEFSSSYALASRLWRLEDDCEARQKRIQQCESDLSLLQGKKELLENNLFQARAELDHILGTYWWRIRATAGRILRR
jgi:hypothetical protein